VISSIGPLEIGIVLVIALLVFGPKRLPELGSSLGKGIRGFGTGLKGDEGDAPVLSGGDHAEAPVPVKAEQSRPTAP
jgi:TatA/E family protein of Tat protein translocase